MAAVPVPGSKTETELVEPGRGEERRPVVPARPNLLKPGTILQSRYRVLDVLGVGGMSTVYRARDLRFANVDRQCAVKEMFNVSDDPRLRQMRLTNFQREAALLATLTHPAIPRIYDYFEQQGTVYLVLELIQGHDLETILSQRGDPFPEEQIVGWALDLCSVLTYLHGQQPEPVIFRDLKPSNIMLRNDATLMLVDFGIARTFAPMEKGTMIGTEGYAPPEQYRGVADARGDIYALGATLHHLATAHDPRGETPFTFAQRPPRRLNPKLSPEFEQIILKCVAYTAADRYGSVDELRTALIALRDRGGGRAGAVEAARRDHSRGSQLLAPPSRAARSSTAEAAERLDWVVTTTDEVRGSASHAGGAVYVGSYDGNLYAIDETDGTVRWRFRAQRGIVSRPQAIAEMVLFGSEDHSVYAVSRQNGRVIWSFRTNMPIRSSPAADDKALFVGSDDGFLYRIERGRGILGWRYKTWGPVRSSPLLAEGEVVVGSDDGYLYSVQRDGGRLGWRTNVGSPIMSSPVASAGAVVVGAQDGHVRSFSLAGGKLLWSYQTGKAIVASPIVVDQTVYVGSADGALYALAIDTGGLLWKTPLCRQITSTATHDGEVLYVGGTDGALYCVNRDDGAVRWAFRAAGPIVAKPLVTAEHVVVGSLDGKIYALHRSL